MGETSDADVAAYLEAKGYRRTAQTFSVEKKLAEYFHSEPGELIVDFQRLASWLADSLDFVRKDLEPLLFAMFATIYVALVKRNELKAAARLRSRFEGHFLPLHRKELAEIGKVCHPSHIQHSPFALKILQKKFCVSVFQYSFDLLTSFLLENNMRTLIEVINNNIDVEIKQEKCAPLPSFQEEIGQRGFVRLVERDALRLDLPTAGASASQENRPDSKWGDSYFEQVKLCADQKSEASSDLRDNTMWPSAAFISHSAMASPPQCVDFSDDAACIAYGFGNGAIRIWNHSRENRQQFCSLQSHSGPVHALHFRADNAFFSCSEDGTSRLWALCDEAGEEAVNGGDDAQTEWKNVAIYRTPLGSNPVWDIKSAPLTDMFSTSSHDGLLRIWSTERAIPIRALWGQESDISCTAWHPNCHYIASGCDDGSSTLWDVRSAHVCLRFKHGKSFRSGMGCRSRVTAMCFDKSVGRTLAMSTMSGDIVLYDLRMNMRRPLGTFARTSESREPVWSLSFSRDSSWLASGSGSGIVKVWRTGSMHGTKNSYFTTQRELENVAYETKKVPISRLKFLPCKSGILVAAGAEIIK